MFTRQWRKLVYPLGLAVAIAGFLFASRRADSTGPLASGDAATRVYVAPGSYDEFYSFMSGGFSGQLAVYALPSGRLIKQIPVFSQFAENGWGYDENTRAMLETSYGFVPWDDSHHPELSQTDGVPDGRWLFINANNTPRIARIDLSRFETTEILELPNAAGGHASPFITPDTRYTVSATRFSVPMGAEQDVPISSYRENFRGNLTFVRADQPGKMEIAFQILMPGFDYDLGHAGKGPSEGWFFFTSYNSEQAYEKLEQNASKNDKDYIAAVNYRLAERCVADGKAKTVPARYVHNYLDPHSGIARSETKTSVVQLDPSDCAGMVYYLPTPKSPHGVDIDPTGEFIVGGGKLATTIPVHSTRKFLAAIENREFEGEIEGIPVLKYAAINHGEVKDAGLGPLHTEFDGKGFAYTSQFISSEITKWDLKTLRVVDRIPVYYSVGHLMIPGGDSRKPWGRYLVAMNKITKDRYLPTGQELAQSAQLIDISGPKMKLLLDFPTIGEPHYAQAIPAEMLKDKQEKYTKLTENTNPDRIVKETDGGITRRGHRVDVRMVAIRSHFAPDNLEGVELGDTVYFHVTNVEQDWDIVHGLAVLGNNNAAVILTPGSTKTLRWVPQRVGVFPFYCTDFCSALHQEMQGYIRVSAPGSGVALTANTSKRARTQSGRAGRIDDQMREHGDRHGMER